MIYIAFNLPRYDAQDWASCGLATHLPRYSGLRTPIEIRVGMNDKRQVPHIKVSLSKRANFVTGCLFILSVENISSVLAVNNGIKVSHRVLEMAQDFAVLNKELLIGYFNGEIGDARMVLKGLRRVRPMKPNIFEEY